MWFKLSSFIKGNKVYIKDIIDERPGVYLLRWVKNNKPTSIKRLRNIDNKGIVYIGSAKNLKRRIYELINGLYKERVGNHTIIKTLIFTSLINTIKLNDLEVAWIICENEKEARAQEAVALKYYSDRYGEPPPFNLQIKREFLLILGLGILRKSILPPKINEKLKELIN